MLVASLTGPVAFGVALLGIIVAGGTLIWGSEMGDFTRRMVFLILVIAILVFATNLLAGLFAAGAVIPMSGL
jgi:type IV secretion system protein VirB2